MFIINSRLKRFLTYLFCKKNIFIFLFLLQLLISGCKPNIKILSPKDGGQFLSGAEIIFSGELTGAKGDAAEEYLFSWTSSIDGAIGSGTEFTKNDLSIGNHTITFIGTSPEGNVVSTSVHITVIDSGMTTTIRSSSELVSKLNSLTFKREQGNLPITEDIRIIGTVTVASTQITVPEGLAYGLLCLHKAVSFEDTYGADSIIIKYVLPWPPSPYGPAFLTLTDTTLRFRPLIIEKRSPPILCDFPVIQLIPPSDYTCSDKQTKCPVDNVCYDDYQVYCRYCLALSPEECVCRDESGTLSEGTPCTFFPGGDVMFEGTCRNGTCELK